MKLTVRFSKIGILAVSISSVLFLQGCSDKPSSTENKTTPKAAPATDTSFTTFFQKFASDSAFQLQHLAEDVRTVETDVDLSTDTPIPTETVKPYNRKFKKMTEEYIRKFPGVKYQTHFERPEANRADFRLTGKAFEEDNQDYRYKFRFKDGRWEMFEFWDGSDKLGRLKDLE